jgi:hypothetical protein
MERPMKKTMKVIWFAGLLVWMVTAGCGGGTASSDSTETEELTAELQVKFNSYGRALLERDVAALEGLLSHEIKNRSTEMGSDLSGFADKMRSSMLKEFASMPSAEAFGEEFRVSEVSKEGDAVRVRVEFQGKLLEKPFFFVFEDGEYKLNVRRAGFSTPLPEGSAGSRDNYLIVDTAPYSQGVYGNTMWCNGGTVYVPQAGSAYVSCNNTCGYWFAGSTFALSLGERNCDYNTWGADVYISAGAPGGFYCNDPC